MPEYAPPFDERVPTPDAHAPDAPAAPAAPTAPEGAPTPPAPHAARDPADARTDIVHLRGRRQRGGFRTRSDYNLRGSERRGLRG